MRKSWMTFWISTLLLLTSATLFAQKGDVSVETELSTSSPLLNQQFTIKYKLTYSGKQSNPTLEMTKPDLGENFRVLQQGRGSSVSSNSMAVYEYVYVLQPLKEGSFTIDPIEVLVNGESYPSKPLSIKVLPIDAPTSVQQADKAFVESYVSNASPYKGEEIFLSYKLFSKYHLNEVQVPVPLVLNGFAADHLNKKDQMSVSVENHNGEKFQTVGLNKYQLYPLQEGDLYIDPLQVDIKARVPTGRRDNFWNREYTRNELIKLHSTKLRIRVKPLPTAGRPADFNGAVGDFKLRTTLSDTFVKAGEPLTLKIRISGDGNMKLIGDPKLQLPPGFEAYEPKIKSSNNSKNYEYLLIPSHAGEFTLDPFGFSFFNPKTEQYTSRSSPAFNVFVERGEGVASTTSTAGFNKEEVAMLGKDIRYIITAMPKFSTRKSNLLGSGLFYGGLTLPFALALGLVFLGRQRKEKAADILGNRTRGATKVARKRLKQAKEYLEKNDRKGFYDETLRSVWGYLGDKFGIEQGELSRDKIKAVLTGKKVSEENVSGLVSLLDRCEMALFAPAGNAGIEELRRDFDTALELISRIESEIA